MLDQPPDDILDLICEAMYKCDSGHYSSDPVVYIYTLEKHDVLNRTCHGMVALDDGEYEFLIEDGNWNGTVVRKWGQTPIQYEPQPPVRYTFAPKMALSLEILAAYVAIRKTEEFQQMESGYNYDRYFNGKLKRYWDWAKLHRLEIVPMGNWDKLESLFSPTQISGADRWSTMMSS